MLSLLFLLVAPAVHAAAPVPPPPQIEAKAYILVDHVSGRVLGEKNADVRVEPASLTKLMTAYAVFHALKDGKLRLSGEVPISTYAWKAEGSRTFTPGGPRLPGAGLRQGGGVGCRTYGHGDVVPMGLGGRVAPQSSVRRSGAGVLGRGGGDRRRRGGRRGLAGDGPA